MTAPTHSQALHRLHGLGMLAVLRGSDPTRVAEAATVLVDAGIDVLEITFTVPDCPGVLRAVKSKHPEAVVGAGTVTSDAQLAEAVEADADFIVTPGATPALLASLARCGKPFLPGVLTPSEVMAARAAGAPGVKLFPGSLTGPAGVAALRGPFPDLLIVPTGGVSPTNVGQWLAAGSYAVGAGSDLAPVSAVDAGDHDLIRTKAEQWLAALSLAKAVGDDPRHQ